MANVNNMHGFFPHGHLDGSPFNGKLRMYLVPSTDGTAIYIGDPVKSAGSAGAAGVTVFGQDVEGMPTIAAAAAGNPLRGVVVGFLPNQSDLSVRHRAASTNRIALVADAPDIVFEAQEDSIGSNLAATGVGANLDFDGIANGNTTTGVSGAGLDSSGIESTTTSAQFLIIGLLKSPDNAIGTYARWLVMINEHELKATSGV